jgi:LysM repeat protein
MKNHRVLIIFVVVLLAMTLVACERKASTPPPNEGPFPTTVDGTPEAISTLGLYATQTAQALAPESGSGEGDTGGESPAAPTATSAPPPAQPEQPQQPTPAKTHTYPVPDRYTLQKGEFPYCIARRFNISPGALLAANGLTNSSVTYPGQTLTIPKGAGPFDAGPRALRSHPTTYTVRAGDTVYSIACLFGDVDPRAIEDANGLDGAYTLPVGGTLHIP